MAFLLQAAHQAPPVKTNRQKDRQTTYKQTDGKTNRHFKMDGKDILVIMVVGLRVATEIFLIKIVFNQNNRHLSPQISTIYLYRDLCLSPKERCFIFQILIFSIFKFRPYHKPFNRTVQCIRNIGKDPTNSNFSCSILKIY